MPLNIPSMLILAGIILLFIGLAAIMLRGDGRMKGGAVVLIGPLPLIAGTDRRITLILAVLALAIMIIWFLATVT